MVLSNKTPFDLLYNLAILGLIVLLGVLAVVLFVILRHRWARLANAPAKLLLRGDAPGAERAFTKAITRAREFAANDYRRGEMAISLAGYLKTIGQFDEAKSGSSMRLSAFLDCSGKPGPCPTSSPSTISAAT